MNSRAKLLELKIGNETKEPDISKILNDHKQQYINKLRKVQQELRVMEQKVSSLILDELG